MHINPLFWHQSFIWIVDYSVEGSQGGFRGWLGRNNNYLAWQHHFTKMGDLGHKSNLNLLLFFYWSVCTKPGKWVVMYMCAKGISCVSLYMIFRLDFRTVQTDFLIGFWNHSDRFSVWILEPFRQIFWLDFRTVQTDFLIGFWNRSDRFSDWDFGTVQTDFLFFILLLRL